MSTTHSTTPRTTQAVLSWTRDLTDPALRAAVGTILPATQRIVSYHFGWQDQNGNPTADDSGKALRPALALICAQASGSPAEGGLPAAVAVELVHNFSLLHDDVMDADQVRRHRPTAWSVFGVNAAILAGDALLGLAFEVLADSRNRAVPSATRVLGSAVQELVDGQLADWQFETQRDIGLDKCVRMAQLKTGSLIGAACATGAALGGADIEQIEHLWAFGRQFGLAYQYVDDILGIWGDPDVTGKPAHTDLQRRKKSLPVVAAMTSGTAAGRELIDLYDDQKPWSEQELVRVANLIEQSGARDSSQSQADSLLAAALDELRLAGADASTTADLEGIARLATRRDH